jgi:hypothetical protein
MSNGFSLRDAQRDAHSTEVPSQGRSMLALFSGQGCDISQPYGNRRVTKGCSQAYLLMSYISLHISWGDPFLCFRTIGDVIY